MNYFDAALHLVWGFGALLQVASLTMPIYVSDGVTVRKGRLKDRGMLFIFGMIIMGFGSRPF